MKPIPIVAAFLTIVVALHLIGGVLILTTFLGPSAWNKSISYLLIGIIAILVTIVLIHLLGFTRTMHK
jgi:hypothetical protein